MDSSNIIGGMVDALEKIVYNNDRQIKNIQYEESHGNEDSYIVEITKIR